MHIEAINLPRREALLTDGSIVPITNLLDIEGDETADIAVAVAFVCGRGREWLCAPLADYEQAVIQ